jgi:hypothetical protein
MFFWTNGGKPLSICLYKDMIFFASTKKILQQTLKPKTEFTLFTPDIAYATVYEHELLEYDLQKNAFYRRGIIKTKVSKEAVYETQSHIVSSHFTPVKANSTVIGVRKPLQRGCTQNPKDDSSPQQQRLLLPPPSPKDFVDDEQYGKSARASAIETVQNMRKTIKIGKDGSKVILYDASTPKQNLAIMHRSRNDITDLRN